MNARPLAGAQALVAEGVDTLFGYPGGAIMPFYDALHGIALKHILVRHEQGAAFAANGYARASGRVGVCVATSGPGASNLVTGIADAMLDSVPMVVHHRPGAHAADGHRCVPGSRRVRHDPARGQTQLPRAQCR
jgi:glyoxylate carboligase